MYQFLKDGETVGIKASPNWIYLQGNGFYGLCDFEKCGGVAIDGTPYHLDGREGLADLETVSFVEISEEEYKAYSIAEQNELLDIITEGVK